MTQEEAEFNKTVGRRIRQWRCFRCLLSKELAAHVGVSASSMSLYEAGERSPSAWILTQIACVLNVPVTVFFVDTEPGEREEIG